LSSVNHWTDLEASDRSRARGLCIRPISWSRARLPS